MVDDRFAGWAVEAPDTHTIKSKVYHGLVKCTRPCATCGEPFSVFITGSQRQGAATKRLGLRNCEQHRRPGPGAKKEREAVAAKALQHFMHGGPERIRALEKQVAELAAERDMFRSAGSRMQDLINENKKRLAAYELPEALRQAATKKPWE